MKLNVGLSQTERSWTKVHNITGYSIARSASVRYGTSGSWCSSQNRPRNLHCAPRNIAQWGQHLIDRTRDVSGTHCFTHHRQTRVDYDFCFASQWNENKSNRNVNDME